MAPCLPLLLFALLLGPVSSFAEHQIVLSNEHLPVDQHGVPLITGEASALVHGGVYYFYFNNWGYVCARVLHVYTRRSGIAYAVGVAWKPTGLTDVFSSAPPPPPLSSGPAPASTAATAPAGANHAASTHRRTRCSRAKTRTV